MLLKPEAADRSQVVVAGVARAEVTATPWRTPARCCGRPWPPRSTPARRPRPCADRRGGQPAAINPPDLVNLRVLDHADAAALRVADFGGGGAFAHLYGIWAPVPDATRRRLAGFVLNKFRGDAGLLEHGVSHLTELTGMAHAGTVPMLDHELR